MARISGNFGLDSLGFNEVLDRIVVKMEIDPITGCFGYLGSLDRYGYGQIGVNGKNMRVHRVMYTILVGEIPEGYDIDHICEERDCFNPDHLQALPRGEHVKITHGRLVTGTAFKCGHEKISENIIYSNTAHDGIKCRICTNKIKRDYYHRRKEGRG